MREFALEAYFSRWQHAVRYNLAASDSETTGLHELLALAGSDDRERWDTLRLGYTDPRGADWLRAAIAADYDTIAQDDICCFAGAQEGIHVAMHALLAPGDHAIVVTPNYQSAETVPAQLCDVTGVPLDPACGWALDIDAVAAALRPNTRLISINFPNNPTGALIDRPRLDALVALCRTHGIWLFNDEVYRLIERDPALRLPHVADLYERGLSLNVVSKAYGLPGLRIGWIACHDRALLARMEQIKHYLSICNSAPSEVLASIALTNGAPLLARNRGVAESNLALLDDLMARTDLLSWTRPNGSVVGYPAYHGGEGVEAFARDLIETAGILVLPASVYRSDLLPTPEQNFRIGFGRLAFPDALAQFERALVTRRAVAPAASGRPAPRPPAAARSSR